MQNKSLASYSMCIKLYEASFFDTHYKNVSFCTTCIRDLDNLKFVMAVWF